MKSLGELIYSSERASGEAISKVESHIPKIEAPDSVKPNEPFALKVKVGSHPNTVNHSIRWIEVYFYENGRPFNPIMLARAFFSSGYTEPEITLTAKVERSGFIFALAYCNLHGLWESRKEIKVVEG